MSRESVLSKLTEALHEPLVTHNWSEALRVLQNSGSNKEVMPVLWKVGSELICKEPDQLTRCSLMRDFYCKMKKMRKGVNPTEVMLDYVLFCLNNGDRDEARLICQEASQEQSSTTDTEIQVDRLLQAHHGLIYYLDWKECLDNKVQLDQSVDLEGSFSFLSQEQTNRMQTKETASKAVKLWTGIETIEGNWDSFVDKYIEVLIFCDKLDVALVVLQRYCLHQPTNICAQKLLYQFYKDHSERLQGLVTNLKEEFISQLKKIVELNPADPLVLEYCRYESDDSKVISCLFTMLDYPDWQHELKPWKKLADYLDKSFIQKTEGSENATLTLTERWKERESWWPSYHFTKYRFEQDSKDVKLLLQKYIAASILCKQENDYTKLARQKLVEAGYSKKIQKVTMFVKPDT